ncbi:MAG TPA: hypothetical protein VLA72_13520, partial [Anaerolineales bacterium]|nr:hypothetical protein [Anaerolineales bacterium]
MNIGVLVGTAVGVLMVWIMLAAITSQILEWVAQGLKWRPQILEETVNIILGKDENLTNEFYDHPLIKSLHNKDGERKPSKIPNRQFASVVFDMFINAGTEKSGSNDLKNSIENLRSNISTLRKDNSSNLNHLAKAMDTILVDVSIDVDKVDKSIAETRHRVEAWYEDAMARMSGAYKRKLYIWTLLIGIILSAALNADSLAIANTLWKEPLVRDALVAQAEQLKLEDLGVSIEVAPQQAAQDNVQDLQSLPIPIGWTTENIPARGDTNGWIMKFGGILVSGIAAAQGAPFWFEIMKKLLNFRSKGKASTKQDED